LPSTVNVANVQSTTLRVNGIEIDPSGAVSDQVLKFNGTKFVPAADVSGAGGGVSYEETIGNNTDTTFTVTHSLNTKNIDVIVRDNVSPYEVIDVRWEATTNDTITLDFSAAPPNNSRRVEIKGPGTQDYYSATIGNGSSSTINLDHNLGTRSVVTVVRNASSPYEVVEVQASAPSINRVTLDFSTAPTANSLVASVYAPSTDYAYESVIGDGSTTEFTITHNLNTRDIGVISRNTVSPYDFTVVKWEATTVNTAKIIFTAAPSTDSRKITVFNSFGGSRYFNPEFGLIDGDIMPNQDNVYTLGNSALRWKSISIGGGTLYITDSGNNNQVALTVNNGVFNINGIAQAQLPNVTVTNLTFSDSTVQTTAAIGIPAGGVTNQLLAKSSDTNYDVQWINEAPAASYTSQVKHLVKNDDSVTLTKGMVVYTSGANGNNILVKRAIATSEIASSQVLGFVEANIAVNATGYVVNNGLISNIDTNSASAAGDPVWLSPTTSGGVVYGLLNKPDAPNHLVYLGVVNRKNANNGAIFVHISNGWELDELHNVSASAPASGDFLKYNGSVWVNDPINLGTDTVGNYMSNVSAGTGIAVSHTPGEGSTATISIESTAWTAYTPTMTADGGGFALNNGTLTGRYKQVGKTVFFSLKFVFGSTTAAGTGHWNFSLPVTAYDSNFTFSAAILDNTISWYGGIGNGNYTGSTSSFAVIIPGTNASVTTWATVGNGGPFIWGTGDNITITGSYEAA